MKIKSFKVAVLALLIANGVFAQEEVKSDVLQSKKGVPILPQQGDYALGFDAAPVINFGLNAVNIMNDTGQEAEHPGYAGVNQTLFGKYFLKDDVAIRGRFGINFSSVTNKTYGLDPLYTGTETADNILLSTENTGSSSYALGAGIEKRRGYNRLQGYYGGELLLGIGTNKTSTKYEIDYTSEAEDAGYVEVGDTRTLVSKTGNSFMLGARGFIGVEYFVAPKISVGGEFGWGLGYSRTGRGKTEAETWSGTEKITTDVKGDSSSEFVTGADQGAPSLFGGNAFLSLNFHF